MEKTMRHDLLQLTEILRSNNVDIKSFIEIGSRDGHDTYYVQQYWQLDPQACIIVEAHTGCYLNIISMYPQFPALNIAASDKTGIVKFNAGVIGEEPNVGISSLFDRVLDPFIHRTIEVDAWRMDEVFNELSIKSIDLAKIDVEGAALQVLHGFGDTISNFKALQIELETKQVWEGQSYYIDVVNYLNSKGFVILHEVTLDEYQKDVLFIKREI